MAALRRDLAAARAHLDAGDPASLGDTPPEAFLRGLHAGAALAVARYS